VKTKETRVFPDQPTDRPMIPPYILPPFQVVVTNASQPTRVHPNPDRSILFTHTMTSKGTAINQNILLRRHFRARAHGKTTTNDDGAVSMVRVWVVSKRRRV